MNCAIKVNIVLKNCGLAVGNCRCAVPYLPCHVSFDLWVGACRAVLQLLWFFFGGINQDLLDLFHRLRRDSNGILVDT